MVQNKRSRQNTKPPKPLTEVELELMNIVWKTGECTIRDVQSALPESRNLAYTSVATIMKILEVKKVLGSRKDDRAHTFFPLFLKSEYEAATLRHVANNLFQGDSISMVMRLLDESDLSADELQSIRTFLSEKLKQEKTNQ